MKIKNKGFTLIELLVVIAIIGILSSVVLASLNRARSKGSNAAVKSNLQGIKSQAEILYDTTSSYDTVCDDQNVIAAVDAAILAGGDVGATVATRCNDSSTEWAVNVLFKEAEGANLYWCTDHTGASRGEPAELGGNTTCA
ncbi:MAG TPA: type II secretion system protein [Candidatus Paceibacterota bacterium]